MTQQGIQHINPLEESSFLAPGLDSIIAKAFETHNSHKKSILFHPAQNNTKNNDLKIIKEGKVSTLTIAKDKAAKASFIAASKLSPELMLLLDEYPGLVNFLISNPGFGNILTSKMGLLKAFAANPSLLNLLFKRPDLLSIISSNPALLSSLALLPQSSKSATSRAKENIPSPIIKEPTTQNTKHILKSSLHYENGPKPINLLQTNIEINIKEPISTTTQLLPQKNLKDKSLQNIKESYFTRLTTLTLNKILRHPILLLAFERLKPLFNIFISQVLTPQQPLTISGPRVTTTKPNITTTNKLNPSTLRNNMTIVNNPALLAQLSAIAYSANRTRIVPASGSIDDFSVKPETESERQSSPIQELEEVHEINESNPITKLTDFHL